MTTTRPPRGELADELAAALSRQWGEPVEVEDVRRLSGGASMETWSALAVTARGARPIILRRDRPGPPQSSRVDEAALLRLVRAAGVPVPEVLAEGAGDEVGTAYLVMEFLAGETIPRKLLRDEEFSAARDRLVTQVGQALAAIHTVPASEVAFLGPSLTPGQLVEALAGVLSRLGCASPVFELAVRWLLANLPTTVAPTLVHGDVRNGNLMVGPAGLSSVLDWELAHPGQPAEDLGWFCVRAWRFGRDDKPAGGFGTRQELLGAYQRAGGLQVSAEDLRFWELFGTLKWGATCLSQVAIHLRGDARSVELAAIGRRVAEVEYDLVLLMEGSA